MKATHLKGSAMLLACAAIWGFAFSAQELAAAHLGTFTIGTIRSTLGTLVLIITILLADRLRKNGRFLLSRKRNPLTRRELVGGIACGIALTAASALLQSGVALSGASKASFISVLYVVLVPLAGALIFHRKIGLRLWCAAGLAVAGLALITLGGGFYLALGDILLLICAVCFCIQILLVDVFLPGADGIRLSAVQFATCAVLNLILALIFEACTPADVMAAILPLLFLGVMSSGCAFTLQILGQRDCPPTPAAILLSTEALFGLIGAATVLGARLSPREYIGCAIMFAAILLSQLPDKKQK